MKPDFSSVSTARPAPRVFLSLCLLVLLALHATSCVRPEFNPTPTVADSDSLSDVMQLTFGFDRAGEAYFSPDMRWIIFQATPKGEKQYQMYVAPLMYDVREGSPGPGSVMRATPLPNLTVPMATDIIRLGQPIRVSPADSRNTCGYFSPDGNSIVFASTAGKERPDEPTSGYQRQGGNYRWSYPEGMEIFRADGWKGALAATEPDAIVDLAKHPLTDNTGYDAEASYSPDGKWLCFTSNRDGDLDLYAMRPDGTDVVRLTHAPGYDGGPFFSPDGRRLLYRSDRQQNDLLQIYVSEIVYDRIGKIVGLVNEQKLTHDDGAEAEVAPAATREPAARGDQPKSTRATGSPTDEQLAKLRPTESTSASESTTRPTSTKLHVNWGPFWHPDGRHIVYATSRHAHTNYEIYMMRDDGTRKTRITHTAGADVLPVFSPDGRYLMWAAKRSKDNTTQVFLAKFQWPKGS